MEFQIGDKVRITNENLPSHVPAGTEGTITAINDQEIIVDIHQNNVVVPVTAADIEKI